MKLLDILSFNRHLNGYICSLLLTIMFLFSSNTIFADESVKISSYDDGGFYILDEDKNEIGGYAFDLQVALNRYLDWDVTYVLDNWNDCFESIREGKTDLLFGVFKTEERIDLYSFNKTPIAMMSSYIVARDDFELLDGDYTKLAGSTFGLVKGAASSQKMRDFLSENGIDVNYVVGNTTKDLREKLKRGEIDYFILNTTILMDNEKIIQKFSQEPMYVMSRKDKAYLLDAFDESIERLNDVNPTFLDDLLSKTYTDKSRTLKNLLTTKEIEFIKDSDTLRCGVLEDNQPFYYRTVDNTYIGLVVSLIKEISKESGLQIQLVPFADREAELEALKNGEIDMLSKFPNDYHAAREYDLNLSVPYLESQITIIKNRLSAHEDAKVYAIPYEIINHTEEIKRNLTDIELKNYDTPQACIDAINNGEVSGAIIEDYNILQNKWELENTRNLDSFVANGVFLTHCFAVSENVDSTYLDIIDKAISTLNTTNINFSLIDEEQSTYSQHLFKAFFSEYKVEIFTTAIFLLIIVLFLSYQNSKTARKNEELKEANKRANEASRVKSEFLANMSHELRTPLNAIIGLNLLLEESLDDRDIAEDYVKKIDQSSKILLSIINDVLDMSAIEAGKLKIANQKFNLKETIYSVTDIYYQQCEDKGINFKFNMSNIEYESLIGDSYRIRQILLNLLSNSVKFTGKGGSIAVSLDEAVEHDDAVLYLSVSDTGCGISHDLQRRLFQKFEQQDATTVRQYGGSGLGLSICKRLVTLMNGDIDVKSEVNVGTTFTVKIPLKISFDDAKVSVAEIKKLDVLIVDEDETSCRYLSSILNRWNIKNEYCLTEQLAINSINERKKTHCEYSLFILNMKINRLKIFKDIRASIDNKLCMVIITGYDIDEYKRNSHDLGAEAFIRKPIFASELFDKIISNMDYVKIENNQEETELSDLRLDGMKILLAEDNKMNQLIEARLLEKKGALVTVSENGLLALKEIERKETLYDAVLMDIQMPVMDGYEATRQIRNLDSDYAKEIPIYAMTANSFNADVKKASQSGMNGHISKPIDTKALFKILYNLKNSKK